MALRQVVASAVARLKKPTPETRYAELMAKQDSRVPMRLEDLPPPTIVDTPRHPEPLTEQHIDHAIEVYQKDYLAITALIPGYKFHIQTIKEVNDDSDWQKRFYKKKRYRLSLMMKSYNLRQKNKDITLQAFNPKRTGILGPDLAASHFITYRGGRVKFCGSDKWITKDFDLPGTMDTAFKVEKLDASGCSVRYEGLDNLINLKQMVSLDLSSNPLDDWSCGRLACHFRDSKNLRYLNLSDNPDISSIGIQSLVRIPSLETLVITDTKAARYEHLELLILLFQDVNPRCVIKV